MAKEIMQPLPPSVTPRTLVEVVAADDSKAHLVLTPKGVGELHVHADRPRHWQPFYMRTIEPAVAA